MTAPAAGGTGAEGTPVAASLIAGTAAMPTWLPAALERGAAYLRTLLDGARAFPDRPTLRGRMAALVAALELVEREADAWPVWMMLGDGARAAAIDPEDWRAANAAVPRLLAAARGARDSIREGHGRDGHRLNPDGLSYQQICAAVIAVAWGEVHGSPAPHTAPAAHHACAALWAAAGGRSTGWSGTGGGWRAHLEAAKGAEGHPGMWIIRDIITAARTDARVQTKAR